MKRRTFLAGVPALATGLALGNAFLRADTNEDKGIRIDQPFHGAVLHERLKEPVTGVVKNADGKPFALKIRVTGEAPEGVAVSVNGVLAKRDGKRFEAEIELKDRETEIVVTTPAQRHSVKVWWLKNSFPRYRFTMDDVLYCLREISQKPSRSLFDEYFFKNIRELHRKFGTKFALNLFYSTGDGFDLSMVPDRYKGEFRDNADWLRLLFHADKEFPNKPYKDVAPERILSDMEMVRREVVRFAGEQTYLPVNVIHFGEYPASAWKPLYDAGVRVLSNAVSEKNERFGMDLERRRYLGNHDFLVDFDSGMVFGKVDMVLNLVPLDKVEPTLREIVADPNRAEFVDLLTHEQYFWPFYKRYLPDHWDRLETAFRFVTERGYKPVFVNDPFLGLEDEKR